MQRRDFLKHQLNKYSNPLLVAIAAIVLLVVFKEVRSFYNDTYINFWAILKIIGLFILSLLLLLLLISFLTLAFNKLVSFFPEPIRRKINFYSGWVFRIILYGAGIYYCYRLLNNEEYGQLFGFAVWFIFIFIRNYYNRRNA